MVVVGMGWVCAACSLVKPSTTTPSSGGVSEATNNAGGASRGGEATPASGGDPSGTVTMPNLVGKTEAEANEILRAAGFANPVEHSSPVSCDNAPKDPGKINCQAVDPGTQVRRYALVQVNIYQPQNLGHVLIENQLMALVGKSVDDAKAELAKLGYQGKVIVSHSGTHCTIGNVCGIYPSSGVSTSDPNEELTFYVTDSLKISTPDD
jgi:beta-lactam-binding protein with PASTA domain